jgi:hypothetical protein
VEKGQADEQGVAGLKPWRQFMVEMQIQRIQEVLGEQAARASEIQHALFKEIEGGYD